MSCPVQITLYSLRDKYSYQLPGVPMQHVERTPELEGSWNLEREPWRWMWMALDGKLYAIGGEYGVDDVAYGSQAVYVLDLAGQREWKECASVEEGRVDFGCGVMDGRIYVFGGTNGGDPVCGSEVYDPKDNIWSSISPAMSPRYRHGVEALGEELVLFNGRAYDPESAPAEGYNDDGSLKLCSRRALFWDVYHPGKDEWHIVRPASSGENRLGTVFLVKGKFYKMIDDTRDVLVIDVYDYDKKTWSQLHTSSLACIPGLNARSRCYELIVANDELVVAVCNLDSLVYLLLRNDGFGSDKKEILWKVENEFPSLNGYHFRSTVEP